MIKGVNHQIIEISDTGSLYYERAWLIVKPQYTQIQASLLKKEAEKILKDTGAPSSLKPRRNFLFWTVRLGLAAVIGSALTVLTQHLFL